MFWDNIIKYMKLLTMILLVIIIYYIINIGNKHVEERKKIEIGRRLQEEKRNNQAENNSAVFSKRWPDG